MDRQCGSFPVICSKPLCHLDAQRLRGLTERPKEIKVNPKPRAATVCVHQQCRSPGAPTASVFPSFRLCHPEAQMLRLPPFTFLATAINRSKLTCYPVDQLRSPLYGLERVTRFLLIYWPPLSLKWLSASKMSVSCRSKVGGIWGISTGATERDFLIGV